MDNLKNTFEKMDIKKVEKDKEFQKLYDAVKQLLENDIYEDCYIFEYIELSHRSSTGREDHGMIVENDEFVNIIDHRKCKKIVKFNLEDYNPKATKEEKMDYIMDQANNDGTLKFYFNTPNNKKNLNKHLYSIVDVGGYDCVTCFTDSENNEDTLCYAQYNDIIPLSLISFKM